MWKEQVCFLTGSLAMIAIFVKIAFFRPQVVKILAEAKAVIRKDPKLSKLLAPEILKNEKFSSADLDAVRSVVLAHPRKFGKIFYDSFEAKYAAWIGSFKFFLIAGPLILVLSVGLYFVLDSFF